MERERGGADDNDGRSGDYFWLTIRLVLVAIVAGGQCLTPHGKRFFCSIDRDYWHLWRRYRTSILVLVAVVVAASSLLILLSRCHCYY